MAAYYHILLPYQITFPETEENQEAFDVVYKSDFVFKKRKKEGIRLNDFDDFEKTFYTKDYILNSNCIMNELKSLILEIYAEWILEHKKLYKSEIHPEELKFLNSKSNKLDELTINQLDKKTIGIITEKLNNYLYFTSLTESITYTGFPLSDEFELSVVSIIRSYNKIQAEPEEEKKLLNFLAHFQKKYSDRYKLTNYLFVAGF